MLQTREVRSSSERNSQGGSERPRSHLSYFKRALRAELLWARPGWTTYLPRFKPRRASAKAGLAYEAKVLKQLSLAHPSLLISQVPFLFDEGKGKKAAVPDALLFNPTYSEVCVIEIKLRHTADAYHQLNDFYLPIVWRAFGRALRVTGLEICKYYDPLVKLPRPAAHITSTAEAFEIREGFHPILLWSRFDGRVA